MWIRSLEGDYINMDNITCLHVTVSYCDYRYTDHCVVYAEGSAGDYPLWAEKIASNDGKDIENTVRRANLFVDALVNRLNS